MWKNGGKSIGYDVFRGEENRIIRKDPAEGKRDRLKNFRIILKA